MSWPSLASLWPQAWRSMWACALMPRSAAMAARSIMREKPGAVAVPRVPRQARTAIAILDQAFEAGGHAAIARLTRLFVSIGYTYGEATLLNALDELAEL